MEIINDFSFLAPYMIKSVILFLVIGLSSIVVYYESRSRQCYLGGIRYSGDRHHRRVVLLR